MCYVSHVTICHTQVSPAQEYGDPPEEHIFLPREEGVKEHSGCFNSVTPVFTIYFYVQSLRTSENV